MKASILCLLACAVYEAASTTIAVDEGGQLTTIAVEYQNSTDGIPMPFFKVMDQTSKSDNSMIVNTLWMPWSWQHSPIEGGRYFNNIFYTEAPTGSESCFVVPQLRPNAYSNDPSVMLIKSLELNDAWSIKITCIPKGYIDFVTSKAYAPSKAIKL